MWAVSSAPTARPASVNAASPGTENSTADRTSSGLLHSLLTYLISLASRKTAQNLLVVLVVQSLWLSVGLVIERSLVPLPAGALSSQIGQLSLPSLRGR